MQLQRECVISCSTLYFRDPHGSLKKYSTLAPLLNNSRSDKSGIPVTHSTFQGNLTLLAGKFFQFDKKAVIFLLSCTPHSQLISILCLFLVVFQGRPPEVFCKRGVRCF